MKAGRLRTLSDILCKGETAMYLVQPGWTATTGLGLSRIIDRTSSPNAAVIETTSGPLTCSGIVPVVPSEEQEWASLLSFERKRAARKRITSRTVNKAVQQLRYGR